MKKVFVNEKEVLVSDSATVMQACEIAGEEIPRFCYHESLSIACLLYTSPSPRDRG